MEKDKNSKADVSATEWLNEVLKEAIRRNASDVHIVPHVDHMSAHYRLDGVMQEIDQWDKQNHETVISRLKVVSGLAIAEKHLPQDGHLEILLSWVKDEGEQKSEKQLVANFRVSVMPTVHGEAAVLRALNKRDALLSVDDLGFSPEPLKIVKNLITRSHGMVLVTGPTGSGKTTTLYALLNSIRTKEKTIITLEDPVEFSLAGVRQTQISPIGGLTFGVGLKAVLRQDPDVVMVGEIRDNETAEIGMRAALSGRLVFSTFHSSDIPGVVIRLVDMDTGRSIIASAITGIITQRLVRKICAHCQQNVPVPMDQLRILGVTEWPTQTVVVGKGCDECGGTGYKGRVGIFEILHIDDELRGMIIEGHSFDKINDIVKSKVSETLSGDGLNKVKLGVTTIEEVIKAVI